MMSLERRSEKPVIAASQFIEERKYWLGKLRGDAERTTFPIDYIKSPKEKQYITEHIPLEMPGELNTKLMNISSGVEARLHMILTAGVVVLLNKYTGNPDIIVGTTIDKQDIDGDFINTVLPLRHQLRDNMTFRELLLQTRATMVEAIENQNYPMEILINDLDMNRDNPHDDEFPLFDVAVLLENLHDKEYLNPVHPGMIFCFKRVEEKIEGVIHYNPLLYNKETGERIGTHFTTLLRMLLDKVDGGLENIELLSEKEKKRLLYEFNETEAPYPGDKTIHRLFEEQVVQAPDHTALVGEITSPGAPIHNKVYISYRELNEKSNRLAHILRQKGIKPDTFVGIRIERSIDMIIGILGIIKAGGAYMPIDPAGTPTSRVVYMLKESRAPILLINNTTLDQDPMIFLEDLEDISCKPYITGRRPQIKDFDGLPFPDRSLVDYEKYSRSIGMAMAKNCMALQTTRGCPYNCAYCHKIWPKSHVIRSAHNIFSEIQTYYRLGIKKYSFIDDIFNLDKKNSMTFFQLLIQHMPDVQLYFPNGLRGDILTKEYIDIMVQAGAVEVTLALETASPRLQKLIGKKLDIERLRDNLRYICEHYPRVILELQTMHGFPSETEEEALMTLDFIKSIKWIHFPYVNVLKIYPNTDMEKIALAHGISRTDILKSVHLAHHEVQDTLPFDKAFTKKYQADFLNEYFLNRERLIHVLTNQMKRVTEDEIVQKYRSYLPVEINTFEDILRFTGITRDQLNIKEFLNEPNTVVPDLNNQLKQCFPKEEPDPDALRILLLDLSQYFSAESDILYDVEEPPLGLMYVLTYLNRQFGARINGKIAKSRFDFDHYLELKKLVEEFNPDVIGIRTIIFYKGFFHKTVTALRQWGIDVPIIAGGPYATSSYETILQDKNIDLVVLGEGEITFSELIGKMIENEGKLPATGVLKEIPGLAFILPETRRNVHFPPQVINLDTLLTADLPAVSGSGPEHLSRSRDLAYLIFTSGSTGNPKGVPIEHHSVVNRLHWMQKEYPLGPDDVILQKTPYTFDVSVWELFWWSHQGASLCLLEAYAEGNPPRIIEETQKYRITTIHFVPSMLNAFLHYLESIDEDIKLPSLRQVFASGEALEIFHVERFKQLLDKQGNPRLINLYGPTEATVDVSYFNISPLPERIEKIPIGKPIDNIKLMVLDKQMKLQPVGITGELGISGHGLARGYINRPELTAEKFVQCVTGAGDRSRWGNKTEGSRKYLPARGPYKRIYKTGDLAKWLPDGNIEFLGRIDHQVKIRGFRIELGEIENRLLKHNNIDEVVVVIKEREPAGNGIGKENRDKYICAYFVSNSPLSASQLREYLLAELSEYMIPSFFVQVEQIPLTASGKVDRRHLPEPKPGGREDNYEPPRNEIEETLLDIWSAILGVEKIGINDNFFQLGGDSIKTIQIAARIREHGLKLDIKDIFEHSTVKELAPLVKTIKRAIPQEVVEGEVPLTPAQQWFFQSNFTHNHHFNQGVMIYREEGFDEEIVKIVFRQITVHHDALRMIYENDEEEKRTIQRNRGIDGRLFDLEVFNMEEITNIESEVAKEVDRIQGTMNLKSGPLVKLGLFKTDQGDHLLIVIHHLVIDGVSWRILLEDFSTGYEQAKKGQKIRFPAKTDSFKYWAEKLNQYANSREVLKEIPYWKSLETSDIEPIPKDIQVEREKTKRKYTQTVMFTLTKNQTRQLLHQVNRAYNTEINDILLTAMVKAVRDWRGIPRILINLEGHGREDIIKDVDISRTVGWYTSNIPVLLDISQLNDLNREIKHVKELLRKIPGKGIGYGILKYLTSAEKKQGLYFSLEPEISFNYLGQFRQNVDETDNSVNIGFSRLPAGNDMSPEMERFFTIDVTGISVDSGLSFFFHYNGNEYKRSSIETLARCYQSALIEVIDHCLNKKEKELTPSDFTKKDMDMEELDGVLEMVADIPIES
ncbi:MAG: amino acid adenylation domain-containing protein [Candidatus Aminicenantes bacterium]